MSHTNVFQSICRLSGRGALLRAMRQLPRTAIVMVSFGVVLLLATKEAAALVSCEIPCYYKGKTCNCILRMCGRGREGGNFGECGGGQSCTPYPGGGNTCTGGGGCQGNCCDVPPGTPCDGCQNPPCGGGCDSPGEPACPTPPPGGCQRGGPLSCGEGCCDVGQHCINNSYCCPSGNKICGNVCCAGSNYSCLGSDGRYCCPADKVCGGACCGDDESCQQTHTSPSQLACCDAVRGCPKVCEDAAGASHPELLCAETCCAADTIQFCRVNEQGVGSCDGETCTEGADTGKLKCVETRSDGSETVSCCAAGEKCCNGTCCAGDCISFYFNPSDGSPANRGDPGAELQVRCSAAPTATPTIAAPTPTPTTTPAATIAVTPVDNPVLLRH